MKNLIYCFPAALLAFNLNAQVILPSASIDISVRTVSPPIDKPCCPDPSPKDLLTGLAVEGPSEEAFLRRELHDDALQRLVVRKPEGHSGVWSENQVIYFSYTPKELVAVAEYHYFDREQQVCLPAFRERFFYDHHDRPVGIYTDNRNRETGAWDHSFRYIISYNAKGQITESSLAYAGSDIKGWQNYQKVAYSFGANGRLHSAVLAYWDNETGAWHAHTMKSYTYTALDLIESVTVLEKQAPGEAWIPLNQAVYGYSGSQKVLDITFYRSNGQTWVSESRNLFTYDDPSGNLVMLTEQAMQEDLNTWVNVFEDRYAYDSRKQLISAAYYYWSRITNAWTGGRRQDIGYTESGDISATIDFKWDAGAGTWQPASKSELMYDNAVDGTDVLWPPMALESFSQGDFKKKLSGIVSLVFDAQTQTWLPTDSVIAVYSTKPVADSTDDGNSSEVTSLKPAPVRSVSVYPNPAVSEIRILGDEKLVDAHFALLTPEGKIILQTVIPRDGRILLRGVEPGGYFFRITTVSQVFSGKLIVQK